VIGQSANVPLVTGLRRQRILMPHRTASASPSRWLITTALMFQATIYPAAVGSAGSSGAGQTDARTNASAISHHYAQANGVRYHYARSGSGPTVVLLHGWSTTWYHWNKIFPKLAERFTVIAPDLRGIGLTDKPDAGYDKRTVAEDIYQLIRRLGQERVYVVGHDIGGMVAFALAHEHPEVVQKLVILDVPIPGLPMPEDRPGGRASAPLPHGNWWPAFHQVPDLPEVLVSGNVRAYLEYFYRLSTPDPTAVGEDEIVEYVRAYSRPGALRAGFAYYRAFNEDAQRNASYARTKLRMPILALGGALSTGEGPLRQLSAVGEDVQGGVLEEAGHFPASEQPEELTRRLIAFFGAG
jgi:pimeloyl-ACP methyl ester carboxylesterase